MAGICLGIGGIVYLKVENNIVGAFLFGIGLFTICTFDLNLFTGKVCYIFENKPSYTLWTLTILLGNFIGTAIVSVLILHTRHGEVLRESAIALTQAKISDSILSTFILAIFCNIIIHISAEGHISNRHEIGKYLGIILGVMVFILCGFEHCIANMFFFSVAGVWDSQSAILILVTVLGNAVGGTVMPLVKKLNR